MKPFFVQISINPKLYLKDPQQTKLGKKIIEHSVLLIDQLGLDQFTFKKLATAIPSSEASIYRYFENKHNLFVYLLNWYWEWMIARIELNTLNIQDPKKRLQVALSIIVDTANKNMAIEYVDEDILHKIVVREGAKAYHTKLVDKETEAYQLLENRKVDAIVYDSPVINYYAQTHPEGNVKVVGLLFKKQDYGLALQKNSPLREKINLTILKLNENGTYEEIYERWFGKLEG